MNVSNPVMASPYKIAGQLRARPTICDRFKDFLKTPLERKMELAAATSSSQRCVVFSLKSAVCIAGVALALATTSTGYKNYLKFAEAAKEIAITKVLAGNLTGTGAAQGRLYDAWDQSTYAPTATATLLHKDSSNSTVAVNVLLRGQLTPDVRVYERREKNGNPDCWVPQDATTKRKAYLCTNDFGS